MYIHNMSASELTLVYRHGTLRAARVLSRIRHVLEIHAVEPSGFRNYEKAQTFDEIVEQLSKTERDSFYLTGPGFEFDLASVRNFKLDLLEI